MYVENFVHVLTFSQVVHKTYRNVNLFKQLHALVTFQSFIT